GREGFELGRAPLLRARLLRVGEGEHVLALALHHIISDGWSMGVLVGELAEAYEAAGRGEGGRPTELPIQYADFARWQKSWSEDGSLRPLEEYWARKLEGLSSVMQLPADRPAPASRSYAGDSVHFLIGRELTEDLKLLAKRRSATLYMTALAAFKLLLSRYCGSDDVVVGTAVATRDRPELEPLIGFLVNTLVLRTTVDHSADFEQLLDEVKQTTLDAYAHQDFPFEKLVEILGPERAANRNPLFQVMFVMQNAPMPEIRLGGLEVSHAEVPTFTSKFDLTLSLEETDEGMSAKLEYSTELFDRWRVEAVGRHYVALLEALVEEPQRPLWRTPMLGAEELRRQLSQWNETGREYPRESCIHELFEQQAARTPAAVALVDEGRSVTYGELNARANQLAHRLRAAGAGPEVRVGIALERSVELVVALLGVLKAGGAYLPLDPGYPQQRLDFMLEDGGVRILLTREALLERLPEAGATTVICLDRDWPQIVGESTANPEALAVAENLAYVIYTSGSTGRPKGVAVTHRNVVRLVKGADYVSLSADETFLAFAPVSFDASTFEIWGSLLNGARLAIMPADASTEELGAAIGRHGVSTLWLTAGLFHLMVDEQLESLRGVRQLLAGGDVLSAAHVEKVTRELSGCRLINGYGPTEGTTFTCCHTVSGGVGTSVPIGRPISNTKVYILDRHLNPLPTGAAGELFIGGDGLSRGYLRRPALTAERFIPDPFAADPGSRLYRTGDLARFLPTGEVEFLGRRDQQVKLRGFRIEPGEVEAALLTHPAVAEAAAVVSHAADSPAPADASAAAASQPRLVAFFVPGAAATAPAPAELREHLRSRLPDYMLPSALLALPALPLTPNGKLDRQRLSALASASAAPHFRLYTNALGGGPAAAGSYFPHDEFYDASTRQTAEAVA
ncbi:MAG TPA: amino acid adenylation domain-containing protein, partial [Pyrinomonadaceae bacterium]|nr:amino acid adenylation domain-containing protein [Pyrinomonadaceae bacterium]